jgi:hypothetical protein
MKVFFYNYRNGDFHIARSFINDIMRKMPIGTEFYYYSCLPFIGQNDIKHILCDIPNLKKTSPYKNFGEVPSPCHIVANEIFINSHIDACGVGATIHNCVFQILYESFKRIYNILQLNMEEKLYYLPVINFKNLDVSKIDALVRADKEYVFFANNIASIFNPCFIL